MSDDDEKRLLEKLIVDEKSVISRLVERAQGIVGIDRETGSPVILAPRTRLTDRDQIFLLLLGRYFSYKLGRSDRYSLDLGEVVNGVGIDAKAASARLSDLKRERLVEGISKGEYRIIYANAESGLGSIAEKLRGR